MSQNENVRFGPSLLSEGEITSSYYATLFHLKLSHS